MKIAVFGATGRTGRHLVKEALAEGHDVVALARDPMKMGIRHERLRVVRGDVLDPKAVGEVVRGSDAVINVLGRTKGSPKDLLTRGTGNIVAAMKEQGVRRFVSLTGAGVRDAGDRPKIVDRVFGLLLRVLDRDTLRDAARHAEEIRSSGLDWVIVRGPRLTEGPKRGTYRVGLVGKNSGTQVSRADLAGFILQQVSNDEHLRRMPVVSY